MTPEDGATPLLIGPWQLWTRSGELIGPNESVRLEPKVLELLVLLAERADDVVSRDAIIDRLWPDTVVGEDTLARTVSKLRKALGDDSKAQRYIETLSKRGYRLIVPASQRSAASASGVIHGDLASIDQAHQPVLATNTVYAPDADSPKRRKILSLYGVVLLLAATVSLFVLYSHLWPEASPDPQAPGAVATRANDFYFQYSRPGNESAIALFEQLIATKPEYGPGYAGLANALVQKVVRWQRPPADGAPDYRHLGDAIRQGHTRTATAQQTLIRALQLAEQAVELDPDNAESHKALGFVFSAQERYGQALASYQHAVSLDQNAWGALINIGDVLEIAGRNHEALPYFEAAHAAMTRVYDQQAVRLLPWYAALGVVIGDRHAARGDGDKAVLWYRRVLDYAPLHPDATRKLALLLLQSGNSAAAQTLCAELQRRIGTSEACPHESAKGD